MRPSTKEQQTKDPDMRARRFQRTGPSSVCVMTRSQSLGQQRRKALSLPDVAVLVGAAIMFSACSLLPAASSPPGARVSPPPGNGHSGVVGRITMGPMCNVGCPDKAVQSRVLVLTAQGETVGSATSAKSGRFRIRLVPGDYKLRVRSPFTAHT